MIKIITLAICNTLLMAKVITLAICNPLWQGNHISNMYCLSYDKKIFALAICNPHFRKKVIISAICNTHLMGQAKVITLAICNLLHIISIGFNAPWVELGWLFKSKRFAELYPNYTFAASSAGNSSKQNNYVNWFILCFNNNRLSELVFKTTACQNWSLNLPGHKTDRNVPFYEP